MEELLVVMGVYPNDPTTHKVRFFRLVFRVSLTLALANP